MFIRYLTYILITCIITLSVSAQKIETIPFEHLNTDEGLNLVLDIYRSHDDFLWIGTGGRGVMVYDNNTLINYLTDLNDSTTISSNFILKIFEDSRQFIWICTSAGISKYNQSTNSFIRYLTPDPYSEYGPIRIISDIYEDSKGRLWIASGRGLYQYDYSKDQMELYLIKDFPFERSSVTSIDEDNSGNLWLGYREPCIVKFNADNGDASVYIIEKLNKKRRNIKKILVDNDNQVWLTIDDLGFAYFDQKHESFEFYELSNDGKGVNGTNMGQILEYDKDNLFIAVDQGGINVFHKPTKSFTYISAMNRNAGDLSADGIRCLYKDNEGIIWVGTSRGGINIYNPKEHQFNNILKAANNPYTIDNKGLSIGVVSCFYEDSDSLLWIGTDGGGINVLDRRTGLIKIYTTENSNISSNTVRSISQDSNGNMILLLWRNKIEKFIKKQNRFEPYSGINYEKYKQPYKNNNLWTITVDYKKRIWLAFVNGSILVLDQNGNELKYILRDAGTAQGNNNIFSFEDDPTQIYNTTREGLFKFNEDSLIFEPVILDSYIISATKAPNNDIWLCTYDQGILVISEYGKIRANFTTKNGLSSNECRSILCNDNGKIWIATNNGLNNFNSNDSTFQNFFNIDGLCDHQFFPNAAIKIMDGNFFFGSSKGVAYFNPENIIRNTYIPNVYLKKIMVSDRREHDKDTITDLHKELIFKWDHNRIKFSFFAINYTFPEKTVYKYKLIGFDKDVNYTITSNKDVTYTNLDPGTYTFHVKAANNDYVWNDIGAKVTFTITPPFWKTVWFYVLCTVLLIGIVYTIIKIKNHNLIVYQRKLKEKVKERTAIIHKQNKKLKAQKEELLTQQEILIEQKEELFAQSEQLLIHKNKLEVLVEERTKDYKKAKEKAERSDKLKSYFLANMSHEIRTPMNAIIGFSSLLEDDSLTNDQKHEFINLIISNSNSLLFLIEDILDFSQIEANQLNIKKAPFNVDNLINEVHSSFSLRNNNQNLVIEKENQISINNFELTSDSHRVRQILTNLVGNAIKFTEHGNIKIGSFLENDKVIFYVEDTGKGMSEEQQKIIFDQFVKLDRDQVGAKRGIGLGLAISKRLAILLNGELYVHSKLNQGSRFTLSLPI